MTAGQASKGEVRVLRDIESEVRGRDVVIIDDILDFRAHARFRQGEAH